MTGSLDVGMRMGGWTGGVLLVGLLNGCGDRPSTPESLLADADAAFRDGRFAEALEAYDEVTASGPREARLRSATSSAMCVARLGNHREGAHRFEALYESFEDEMSRPGGLERAILMIDQLNLADANERVLVELAAFVGDRHRTHRAELEDYARTLFSNRSSDTGSEAELPPDVVSQLSDLAYSDARPLRFRGAVEKEHTGVPDAEPWLLFRFRRAPGGEVVHEAPWTDYRDIEIELPEEGEMLLDVLVGGEVPFVTGYRFRAEMGSREHHVLTPDGASEG